MMYCPNCGSETKEAIPPGDQIRRCMCPNCGHVHYENPKILVACIIYQGERVLWMKRAHKPYAGSWAIPAGFMEQGETVQQAACRELREETGISLRPGEISLYSVLSLPDLDQVYITYYAPLQSHNFQVTEESLEIRLLSQTELADYKLAYPPEMDQLIFSLYSELQSGGIQTKAPLSLELSWEKQ
jgi:ADP-ribose pyrophosphatase YjhB (NUDIX family)